VADGASTEEAWAASRLSDMLSLRLHSAAQGHARGGSQIAVGHGAAVALGVGAKALAALPAPIDDAYVVTTAASRGVPAGSVAIAASKGSARGTMNGVSAFLRALGFEFFAQNVTRTPTPPIALPDIDIVFSPHYVQRDLCFASVANSYDRKHFGSKTGGHGDCSTAHLKGGNCQANGTVWRPGTNLSAALGLNGHFSFAPVGGGVYPHDPPGFVATAYNLLTPNLVADTDDCGEPLFPLSGPRPPRLRPAVPDLAAF